MDAYHGWLAVSKQELKELGIEQDISNFSYQEGEIVYLEEDVDALTFARASGSVEFERIEVGGVSHIRSMRHYKI